MVKKSYALSRQEKLPKKNVNSILDTKLAIELERVATLPDEKIDLSDIPELDFDKLRDPILGKFYRPTKHLISIRMDSDVLHWFKQHPQYQKLINQACRSYMNQCLESKKSP